MDRLELPPEAITLLLELLDDENAHSEAAILLGGMGPRAKVIVPSLIKKLEGNDTKVWGSVLNILADFGPDAQAAVPAILRCLEAKPDDGFRGSVFRTLGRIGPGAREAVPVLLKTVKDPKASERTGAFYALGDMGTGTKEVVAVLSEVLTGRQAAQSDQYFTRYLAARTLGRFGPAAKAAVPLLKEALVDEDSMVRVGATSALAAITGDSESYLPLLLLAWRDTYDFREPYPVLPHLLDELSNLGPKAAPAVPRLLELLHDEESERGLQEDCISAIRVLERIGPAAKGALPRLRELAVQRRTESAPIAAEAIRRLEGK
jgi:HEAT repeat protein